MLKVRRLCAAGTRIKRDLEINFQKKYKVKLLEKNYSDEKIIRMSGKYANNLMKNTAVLHNPDQVAGGKANIDYEKGSIKDRTDLQNSEIIGTSQVNWYIGTQQWPRKEDHEKRATILKEHAQLQYDKTPEADKGKLMMSVTLKVV